MGRYKKIVILFLGLPLIFCSCLNLKQPSNKIEFYTLEYDPPQTGDLKPLPCVIKMERFSVAPIYNSNRIIYRDKSFKREAYSYHRWRANPGDLVTYFLTRDTKQSGLFKAVLSHESRIPFSYMLEGSVDEFFESDAEEIWNAVLTVSITLMSENEPDISKRIIFQKTYHATEPCSKKNPKALVEAMSKAMVVVSGKIIKDIHYHLKDQG